MKLPNWFKIVWWLVVTGLVTVYLVGRFAELSAGKAVALDIIVFLVWVGLLLAPIFQEVEFLGFKFHQEVQKLKEDFKSEIQLVRTEIRNAVDVRTTISPQISLPAPPPDSQLPELERRIKSLLAEVLESHGIRQPPPIPTDFQVSGDVAFLFGVRYAIERELRRLARERQLGVPFNRMGVSQLSRALAQAEVIELPLDHAIREVYAVSSAAIHAEQVDQPQISFVREVGPELVAALRAVSGPSL
jgi:hypothetical protein